MKNHKITFSVLRNRFASFLLLALALLFILAGILQGDFGEIRNRAIHICLECIGIG